jgi:hypothetical protein
MAIRNKILNFHATGLVRLILILILVLPAGIVWNGHNDYSGRLKIESVNSNKRKPFVGYHFLKCRQQLTDKLKNKLTFNNQAFEFGRTIIIHFKTQGSGFLNFKEKLTDFLYIVFMSIDNDVEKLAVA